MEGELIRGELIGGGLLEQIQYVHCTNTVHTKVPYNSCTCKVQISVFSNSYVPFYYLLHTLDVQFLYLFTSHEQIEILRILLQMSPLKYALSNKSSQISALLEVISTDKRCKDILEIFS